MATFLGLTSPEEKKEKRKRKRNISRDRNSRRGMCVGESIAVTNDTNFANPSSPLSSFRTSSK